ncbi:hypothetical protein, partial [Motilimonas pumila]
SGYAGVQAELVKPVEQAVNSERVEVADILASKDTVDAIVPMASPETYQGMTEAGIVMIEECDCSGVDTCPVHKKNK